MSATSHRVTNSAHVRVRTHRVDLDGALTLRHASRLHHIGIGRRWAGTPVVMLIHELDIRVITENDGALIRELAVDPTSATNPSGNLE